MGREQEDETLWVADKEGKVTLRHSLAGAPPPGQRDYEGIGRVGRESKKKKWGGRSKTRRCGMLTKRGKSRCATPSRALLQVTEVIKAQDGLGGKKNKRDGEGAARRDAVGR